MSTVFPTPPEQPPAEKKGKSFIKWGLIALAAILFLGMCSALVSGGGDKTATPTPAVTKTVTVEKEVRVEVVPQSCLDALDRADVGFTLAAEGMSIVSDAFDAITNMDVPAIEKATADLEKNGKALSDAAPGYNSAKESCRAAGSKN